MALHNSLWIARSTAQEFRYNMKEIRELVKGMSAEEAVKTLTEYIGTHPDDDAALTLRGLKYWSIGERALAINDYLAAIRINPDSKAHEALNAANEILNYFNKDLYNP